MKRLLLSFLLLIASVVADAQNCTINPGACQAKPDPSTCPAGQHWTTQGSGIAHCVANDPPCPNGTVSHDSFGNPIECVPAGPTVVGTAIDDRFTDCPLYYSGLKLQNRVITLWSDGTRTYGDWYTVKDMCTYDDNTYVPPPTTTPTCANGASDYPTCTPPVTSPSPTCANGASDYPTCTPPVTSPSPTCANGASDYPTCTPPSTGSGSGSTSDPAPAPAPTCANGATNYPTCTPPTCSNGATNYPACNSFPGCPYAGQTASTFCEFNSYGGAQGGGDCIEGELSWGREVYGSNSSCYTDKVIDGSGGAYLGNCPGRTGATCPAGY